MFLVQPKENYYVLPGVNGRVVEHKRGAAYEKENFSGCEHVAPWRADASARERIEQKRYPVTCNADFWLSSSSTSTPRCSRTQVGNGKNAIIHPTLSLSLPLSLVLPTANETTPISSG